MKYICLGYHNEKSWESIPENEQNRIMDECFEYDDVLRKNGHFLGGEGLAYSKNAVTLHYQNGKVSVTDGPYAETKEQIGGFMILEAKDLNHAIQLLSEHPGARMGGFFEIRQIEDMTPLISESEKRRAEKSRV